MATVADLLQSELTVEGLDEILKKYHEPTTTTTTKKLSDSAFTVGGKPKRVEVYEIVEQDNRPLGERIKEHIKYLICSDDTRLRAVLGKSGSQEAVVSSIAVMLGPFLGYSTAAVIWATATALRFSASVGRAVYCEGFDPKKKPKEGPVPVKKKILSPSGQV